MASQAEGAAWATAWRRAGPSMSVPTAQTVPQLGSVDQSPALAR